jgi:hypothetical protein
LLHGPQAEAGLRAMLQQDKRMAKHHRLFAAQAYLP